MDQYIGKMLDNRYEILERIGTGGMAIVYKAKCHRLNRLVAIKILKSDLAQNEEFRRRFNAESQAVAQLSHPNIVSVYDVSRGGDMEYIVMELIDGITLKQYMEKQGYKITHTNWHWHHYELDIVAVKDTWLVVVEVKTRSDDYLLAPEDAVDAPKIRRIVAAADAYVRFFNLELPVRFDIITVIKKGEESEIDHIEDAFYAPCRK